MRKLANGIAMILFLSLLSGLSGCAFSDPRIEGIPPTAPASSSALFSQAAEEVRTAWGLVTGMAGADPAGPGQKWSAMSDTLRAQWLVLVGPDPVHRLAAAGIASPSPSAAGTSVTADQALSTARDNDLSRAAGTKGVDAAFWASLAAGLEQVRLGLTGPYEAATPAAQSVTVAITDESAALSDLMSRYDEGIFAIRAAMGFLDLSSPDGLAFRGALSSLQDDLASLTELAGPSGAVPSDAQGIYELPSGRDRDASLALLASTQKSLTEAAMVWVASASDPARATVYVMSDATLAMSFGIGTAVWPGWPD